MKKFSVIFQGKFEEKYLPNIIEALNYTDDVIISTWTNCFSKTSRDILNRADIKIIESIDPGSITAYHQDGYIKQLNIKRMATGLYNGSKYSKYDLIIKTRLDICLDYKKFADIWIKSGKDFASLNVTSNCPQRLLGYPYLFCVSDWCFGINKNYLNNFDPSLIDENRIKRYSPITIKDMRWETKIGAEQILCLLLTQPLDFLYEFENRKSLKQIDEFHKQMHISSLRKFCNVNRNNLDFASYKYNAFGIKWLNYDAPDFSDNSYFKKNIYQLLVFIMSTLYRKLRVFSA
jgi:hypothetical protein